MSNNSLKTIITGIVLVILIIAAIKLVINIFLPIAVVIIAAYIVYMFFSKKRH